MKLFVLSMVALIGLPSLSSAAVKDYSCEGLWTSKNKVFAATAVFIGDFAPSKSNFNSTVTLENGVNYTGSFIGQAGQESQGKYQFVKYPEQSFAVEGVLRRIIDIDARKISFEFRSQKTIAIFYRPDQF